MMENKFNELTDELLVERAKSGDLEAEEYLIRKYKELVRKKSQLYYIIGADGDDVVQEGMIGLFKAIRSYEPDNNTGFRGFAEMCIGRQIISAIRSATRKKHEPLNESISLSDPVNEDDQTMTLQEMLHATHEMEPEAELLVKSILEEVENGVFSDFEIKVWNEYFKGMNYKEIAEILGKSPKAVDNAIQRTKKKIINSLNQ